jgi:dipeptidyl aminopeptidase/acylaminoacyl peptidase
MAAQRRNLTPEDLYNVRTLSEPQVAPDGNWVAYVVSLNDRTSDRPRSSLWMASWNGSQQLMLTRPAVDAVRPRWSPDGRYLAFVATAAGEDTAQIMMLDRRGGDAQALLSIKGNVGEYAWSPDGRQMVLVVEQREAAVTEPIVIDALRFKQDSMGYLSRGRRRKLYLLDIDDRKLQPLTSDASFNEDYPAWSPDGRLIAFIRTRDWSADLTGRAGLTITEARPGAMPAVIARPYVPNVQRLAWSPDGSMIAFLQGAETKFSGYSQDHLFVIPKAGGTPQALTDKLDRAVMAYDFASDSRSVAIAVEDDRRVYLARVDLTNGMITPEGAPSEEVVSALSTAGGHTVVLKANDQSPAELYGLDHGTMRKLTSHNGSWLADVHLGKVDNLRFKSKDGTVLHALMTKPPSYQPGRKYPLALWIHGGPNTQNQHEFVLDGYSFEPQIFAAGGFIVLGVNYRGSGGLGAGFARSIFANWGHKEVEDLLAGVDELVARGIADPQRLVIGGWSYGGMLTDYTLEKDGRFKAAISGAGSGNPVSMYGTDQFVTQYGSELGAAWRNKSLWLRLADPFFHADRIHTPTLFMGGALDFDVPIAGGEQMYEALRSVGAKTQLVIYPEQYHVITRPSFIVDLAQRMLGWYQENLGDLQPIE